MTELDILMPVVRRLCESADTLTDVNDLARHYGQADLAIMMAIVRRLCESAETVECAVDLARQCGQALEQACQYSFDSKYALEKSIELLRSWLSSEQLATFDADQCFYVTGCDTGRRYRVQAGAYIHQVESSSRLDNMWCVAPEGIALDGDVMLAQKIMLETYELEGLSHANKL
jgi:hypothetical protein